MEVFAITKNIPMSAQKMREVVRQIQGLPALQAEQILAVVPRKGARVVAKTLHSAIANAENNNKLRPETLRIKDEKAGIRRFLDAMYSSHEFDAPKEYAEFWLRLRAKEPYDPRHTAFIDDNPKVLEAARAAGIACIIAVTHPDSSRPPRQAPADFLHVSAVADIG